MSEAPDTVVDAEAMLRGQGYTADVQLLHGVLHFRDGDATTSTEQVVVERLYRFEGDSDPGDEMVVFGVRDPASGARGVLATAFGLAAAPDVVDHVRVLASRYHEAN